MEIASGPESFVYERLPIHRQGRADPPAKSGLDTLGVGGRLSLLTVITSLSHDCKKKNPHKTNQKKYGKGESFERIAISDEDGKKMSEKVTSCGPICSTVNVK